ncbi:MAG: hypothetical protein ACLP5H_04180 [Desulfomonilaceae bacterium]
MGSLRKLRSEGTKERRADELDQTDLAYGVPPEGLTLVLLDKETEEVWITFQARRSNFLEKIRKAWRDYANHPQFSGKPAVLAIQVFERRHNMNIAVLLWIRHNDGALADKIWWIQGELETQETANTLWQTVVETLAKYKENPLP